MFPTFPNTNSFQIPTHNWYKFDILLFYFNFFLFIKLVIYNFCLFIKIRVCNVISARVDYWCNKQDYHWVILSKMWDDHVKYHVTNTLWISASVHNIHSVASRWETLITWRLCIYLYTYQILIYLMLFEK